MCVLMFAVVYTGLLANVRFRPVFLSEQTPVKQVKACEPPSSDKASQVSRPSKPAEVWPSKGDLPENVKVDKKNKQFSVEWPDYSIQQGFAIKEWSTLDAAKEAALSWRDGAEATLNGLKSSKVQELMQMIAMFELSDKKNLSKTAAITLLATVTCPKVPKPTLEIPKGTTGKEVTHIFLQNEPSEAEIAQRLASLPVPRNTAAHIWIGTFFVNCEPLQQSQVALLLGTDAKPFQSLPSKLIIQQIWIPKAEHGTKFANISLSKLQEHLGQNESLKLCGWIAVKDDLEVDATHIDFQELQ